MRRRLFLTCELHNTTPIKEYCTFLLAEFIIQAIIFVIEIWTKQANYSSNNTSTKMK